LVRIVATRLAHVALRGLSFVGAAGLVFAPDARAAGNAEDGEVSVLVLPLASEGELADAARESIESSLKASLEAAGLEVVDGNDACSDSACVAERAARGEAGHVLQAFVKVEGRDYQVQLWVADAGGAVSTSEAECVICGFEEVATVVGDEAGAIGKKMTEERAPALLSLTSDPSGAIVRIDGEVVGVTPTEIELRPGAHQLRVEKDGRVAKETEVVAATGVKEALSFTLPELPKERNKAMRTGGWVSLGLGVGFAAGGAALLGIHHKPVPRLCEGGGPDIDENGLCRWRYQSLPWGVTALGLGVAGIVTGAVLIAISSKKSKSDVKAWISPDGIGLTGRF
jgi:hypothetical protein